MIKTRQELLTLANNTSLSKINGSISIALDLDLMDYIIISLFDKDENELYQETFSPSASISFSFNIEDWYPPVMRIVAKIISGTRELSYLSEYFNITLRNNDIFNFCIWDCPVGLLSPYYQKNLAENNTTLELFTTFTSPSDNIYVNNISLIPYTTRIHETAYGLPNANTGDGATLYVEPAPVITCWNDSNEVLQVNNLRDNQIPLASKGVFVYSLGDENTPYGSCEDSCSGAYVSYLRQVYSGSLDALNTSWNTDFADWNTVGISKQAGSNYLKSYYGNDTDGLAALNSQLRTSYTTWTDVVTDIPENGNTYDKNEELAMFQIGNYPRWFDRCAFRGYNYFKHCARIKEGMKEIDPLAKVGFEGAGLIEMGGSYKSFKGYYSSDIDLLVNTMDWWTPYGDTVKNHIIRSLAPKTFPISNWIGYVYNKESVLKDYWERIEQGCDMLSWWRLDYLRSFSNTNLDFAGYIGPDGAIWSELSVESGLIEDTQILYDGLADLIKDSYRENNNIAILFSYPSTYAVKCENGNNYGISYSTSHKKLIDILRNLKLGFDYISNKQLKEEGISIDNYKLLFLIRAESLSDEEADNIRSFVANGGTVIADIRPGIYDGHCKLRKNSGIVYGVLDDLFGIYRDNTIITETIGIPDISDYHNITYNNNTIIVKSDPSIIVNDGICLTTEYTYPTIIQKSNAIFLNIQMDTLNILSSSCLSIFKSIISLANIISEFELLDIYEQDITDVGIVKWTNINLDIVGIFKYGPYSSNYLYEPSIKNVNLNIPLAKHVYDIRTGNYLGFLTKIPITLTDNRPTFLSLCNTQPSFTYNIPQYAIPGQKVGASITTNDVPQVFKISVNSGMNKIMMVQNNSTSNFTIPIAYNAETGSTYGVLLEELFSSPTITTNIYIGENAMTSPGYTKFNKTQNYNDSQYINKIENNLKYWLDWGFLSIGAWTDVSQTGIPSAKLRWSKEDSFTSGQVWQTPRKDIVWEVPSYSIYSGENNIGYNPIEISGVYVSGLLKTSDYYIDYPNGRVVFTGGLSNISTNADVRLNYSFKNVQVYIADDAPWWKELQYRSFNASDTHFTQDPRTGDWSIGNHNRIQLPAIVLEVVPRSVASPYELGNSSLILKQDVLFHIIADDRNTRNKLMSILNLQKDKFIYLFHSDTASKSGILPIDYKGTKINNITYPDLVESGAYRWKPCRFVDTTMSSVQSINSNLYEGVVRATLELIFGTV